MDILNEISVDVSPKDIEACHHVREESSHEQEKSEEKLIT